MSREWWADNWFAVLIVVAILVPVWCALMGWGDPLISVSITSKPSE